MSAAIIGFEQILIRPAATVSDFFKSVLSGQQPSGAFISINRLEEGLSADSFRAELSFQDESEFDFFKQFALRTEDNPAELRLVNLRNAVVFPRLGLVVTEDNKLIDLSCKGYLSENMAALEKLNEIPGFKVVNGCLSLDKELLDSAEIVNFPSIYTMHFGIGVFGHWVFDVLPPLVSQASQIITNGIKVLSPELVDWQRESLEMIGLADCLLETGRSIVRVENLILSSFVDFSNTRRASRLSLQYFDRRLMKVSQNQPVESCPFIYLSRRFLDKRRRMINEAELEHRLEAIGFQILHPEELSADDQAMLMRDAKFVVAAAGSANVNIAFANASTTFIEIFAGDYFDHVFYRLAMMRSVNYIFYREPTLFHDISLLACNQHRAGTQCFSYELNLDRFMLFLQERLKSDVVSLAPVEEFRPSTPLALFSYEINVADDGFVNLSTGWRGSKEQFVSEVFDPVTIGFKGLRLRVDPTVCRSEIVCICNWAIKSFGTELLEIDLCLPDPSDSTYQEVASDILGIAIDIGMIMNWPSTLFFDYARNHFMLVLVRNIKPEGICSQETDRIFRRVTGAVPTYSALKDLIRVSEKPLKEIRQLTLESANLVAEHDQSARRYRASLDTRALWLYQMLYIDEAEAASRVPLLSSSVLDWPDGDAKFVDVFMDTESALVHPKSQNEPATRLILRYEGTLNPVWFGCAAHVSHLSSKPVFFQARILCGHSGMLMGVCEVAVKGGELGYMAVQLPKISGRLTICLFTTMLNGDDSNEFAWAQFVAPSLFNRV